VNSQVRDRTTVARIMSAVRSRNSAPELALRSQLWRRGIRFRVHRRDLPGTPDIAIARQRIAIFVDGDFWHGHQWVTRGLPSLASAFPTNREYWVTKIGRNQERDRHADARLAALGWRSVRIWESDIRANPEACATLIVNLLARSSQP